MASREIQVGSEVDALRLKIAHLEAALAQARSALSELENAGSARQHTATLLHTRTQQLPTNISTAAQASGLPHVTATSTAAEKLTLFRSRFAGRDDVYATRWISARTGKSGWSPAVRGGFHTGSETADDYLALDESVIERHLRGSDHPGDREFHVGIYPMLGDDRCRFLACDFDDANWKLDATAFVAECERVGLGVLAEISRSGSGAHVWMFFTAPVLASKARSLGMHLLRAAMSRRPEMDFRSYDRFFPSQDTLPEHSPGRGRFGNLIALPLEGSCRRRGTTVFADPTSWLPYNDQFAALAATVLVPADRVAELAATVTASRVGPTESLGARPRRSGIRAVAGAVAGREITLHRDATLHVPVDDLPGIVITELKHMASVSNPEFYRKQAQRFSTFGTPRLVTNFEHDEHELRVPRGLTDEVLDVLRDGGFRPSLTTHARAPSLEDLIFTGELRDEQSAALAALVAHDTGVLVAPPGTGKTVIACALIARRATPTAIVVNRAELVAQWRERLHQFLGLADSQIGQFGAGRRKRSRIVDLVMMQSVTHRDADPTLLEEYGQVIIDECHTVAAPATEAALRKVNARYWVGLTATPYRADHMNGLITMQCGPIRHTINGSDQIRRELTLHETSFITEEAGTDGVSIQAIYSELATNPERNALIAQHIRESAAQGRSVLVLTNRLDQLKALTRSLEGCGVPIFQLHGRMPMAMRREIRDQLAVANTHQRPFVLLAIDKIAGEGLDLPALNTLFFAVPVSFKGRVIQQLGRITRGQAAGSLPAVVHDYRDTNVPFLERMYSRRRRVLAEQGFATVSSR